MMDLKRVNEILESYLLTDITDEDVKMEIEERIASLSDDPDIQVSISATIDSEHDGLLAEVTEYGQVTEYIMSIEYLESFEDIETEDE
jgi:hypothetical protein